MVDDGLGRRDAATVAVAVRGKIVGGGALLDLGIHASRGNQQPAQLSVAQVRALVQKARAAGARIISTSASFKALKLGHPVSVEASSTNWQLSDDISRETAPLASMVSLSTSVVTVTFSVPVGAAAAPGTAPATAGAIPEAPVATGAGTVPGLVLAGAAARGFFAGA